jgi:hypothetical protein
MRSARFWMAAALGASLGASSLGCNSILGIGNGTIADGGMSGSGVSSEASSGGASGAASGAASGGASGGVSGATAGTAAGAASGGTGTSSGTATGSTSGGTTGTTSDAGPNVDAGPVICTFDKAASTFNGGCVFGQ